MRTVTFRSVFDGVVRRHGLDPRKPLPNGSDTARAIAGKITLRAGIAWDTWDYPEFTRTEERAFRASWSPNTQYVRINPEGRPDEVYWTTIGYYKVVATAANDPPVGTPPSNTTYFTPFTPEPFIERDQVGQRALGTVLGVYSSDPSLDLTDAIDIALPFRPSERGIRVMGDYGATVFVWYALPKPKYTMVPFVSGKVNAALDRVYWAPPAGDGECYTCLAPTNTALPTDTNFWSKESVPESLANYLEAGAYADCLRDTSLNGLDPQTRALLMGSASNEADGHLYRYIDSLIAQGQKHFYGGNRWWKYGGSGMWVSQPWGGDKVAPLTVVSGIVINFPIPQPPLIYAPTIKAIGVTPYQPPGTVLLNTYPTANLLLATMIVIYTGQKAVLESGPADATDPGQVSPLDYNASTNNKHWREVT